MTRGLAPVCRVARVGACHQGETMDFFAYDDIVHEIYAAGLEPARWPEVVRRIAGACRSPRALLFTPLHAPAQGGFTHSFNMPVAEMEHWMAKGIHEDPFVEAMVRKGWLNDGMVMTGDELVPREHFLSSSFYRDLWQPTGIDRVCAGIVFDGKDMYFPPVALSVYRGLGDPDFEGGEVAMVRRLVAHLARALGLMFHLRDLRFQVAASTAALEHLAVGVVLVDRDGHVVFSNNAARRLFCRAEHVILKTRSDRRGAILALHPRLVRHERIFQAAIREALDPAVRTVRTIQIPNEKGAPVCVVHAAPLPDENAFLVGGCGAGGMVFLYDLESAAGISPDRLIGLYGLTRAEAGVAMEVVRGGTTETMAERVGIAVNTFNTHLKNVFGKTNTHRQADLLKLLLALAVD